MGFHKTDDMVHELERSWLFNSSPTILTENRYVGEFLPIRKKPDENSFLKSFILFLYNIYPGCHYVMKELTNLKSCLWFLLVSVRDHLI